MRFKLGTWREGHFDHGPTFTGSEKFRDREIRKMRKAGLDPVVVVLQ